MLDYIAIDRQTKTVRNYVAPVVRKVTNAELSRMGGEAYDRGEMVQATWPDAMRLGWWRRLASMAHADGAAYLVSQGAEVSL